MYEPTTGEDVLGSAPSDWEQYVHDRGGSQRAAEYVAWNDFVSQFGRSPTRSELNMLAAEYRGGDPNILNDAGGKAAVSRYFQQFSNSPDQVYKRQQAEWQKGVPAQSESVNSIFRSMFGRDADSNELNHYGLLLSSGQADPYELQQFLQTMPEYTNAQDKKFREGLAGELEGYDRSFFNRAKEDVISRFAKMGRTTSPALDVALTDLQGQIAEKRGQYLASLSAQQYGGNKELASAGYKQTQQDALARQRQAWESDYANLENNWNRTRELTDYGRQQADYERMMRNQRQGPGPLDYLNTAFNGVEAGAKAYTAGTYPGR